MTYQLVTKSNTEISFERKDSSFLSLAFMVGGLLILLFGIIGPANAPIKFLLILFGLAFFGAAFYLPNLKRKFSPDTISFNSLSQEVTIAMTNGTYCKLPFHQINAIEIEQEKRSPSAANSTGIHYVHHHVILKRVNGATFTITSTTDNQEAEQICNLLKAYVLVETTTQTKVEYLLPKKVIIKNGDLLEIKWQSNLYSLSIGKLVRYSEHTSNGIVKATKEFPIACFNCVTYSYASTIQHKNFSVYIHFNQQDPAKLGLFLKDLDPVECLQFEHWLHHELLERK